MEDSRRKIAHKCFIMFSITWKTALAVFVMAFSIGAFEAAPTTSLGFKRVPAYSPKVVALDTTKGRGNGPTGLQDWPN